MYSRTVAEAETTDDLIVVFGDTLDTCDNKPSSGKYDIDKGTTNY